MLSAECSVTHFAGNIIELTQRNRDFDAYYHEQKQTNQRSYIPLKQLPALIWFSVCLAVCYKFSH